MKSTELLCIKSYDGYILDVKIDYPLNCESVIILCHGSGANTYDNHREIEGKSFNYYDLFSDEFCKRDIAFCRWNQRGCNLSDTPPEFVDVDIEQYKTYCPSTSIQDILSVLNYIKLLPQFKQSKILLMGISEGATLVPFVAQKCKDISGLLLLGFSYENMRDTLEWQLSGGSSMVNMCRYFDCAEKGFIEKEDFVVDKNKVRPILFPDTEFEDFDIDQDGKITQNDFALQLLEYKTQVFEAIESDDDEWLRENYSVMVTSKWCKEHFALPNISEVMSELSIPIYIFQGEDDANIPTSDIEKIRTDFAEMEKENLQILTFPNHDHDLNYLQYPLYGIISEGLSCVFDMAQKF